MRPPFPTFHTFHTKQSIQESTPDVKTQGGKNCNIQGLSENWKYAQTAGKDPLFGCADGFWIDPSHAAGDRRKGRLAV